MVCRHSSSQRSQHSRNRNGIPSTGKLTISPSGNWHVSVFSQRPCSINEVESHQGRHPASTLDLHIWMHTQEQTHTGTHMPTCNNKQKAQGKISEYSCTITAAPSRQETLILIWMYPNSLSPFFPSFSLSLSHILINHNIIHLEMYLQNLGHKSNQIMIWGPKRAIWPTSISHSS